jgi:hypothetical protein
VPLGVVDIDGSRVCGAGVSVVVVFGVGVNIGAETAVVGYVKQMMTSGGMGSALPKTPNIDFSKFGETQTLALSRINKLSGKHLTACFGVSIAIPRLKYFLMIKFSPDSSNEALKRG